ncbi:MAG TPA: ABC transporter ATP-binding protein [Myxococcota bacterium]|nr:ABC transporter ATP-binding protein [Myxococcota bacterium]HQK49752.1 ABC transporter ATP-binding protein [Myxococcota bacterium]
MDPVLEVRDLRHRFGTTEVLRGLSFEASPGEVIGLVGPDAAGKTTTLRCLAGLIRPSEGQVRILGKDPQDRTSGVQESFGYMPERYSLYGDLTVDENLRFFGDLFCLDRTTWRQRRDRLLEVMDLGTFLDRRADALSGGMYKKLALACALLHEPALLILDEPTNGVDPDSRAEIWERIGEFSAQGMTLVVATSYLGEAARCSRAGILSRGRMVAFGPPMDLVRGIEEVVLRADPVDGTAEALWERLGSRRGDLGIVNLQGAHLRIVTPPSRVDATRMALEQAGARTRPVAPSFEDLFLVRTTGEETP